MRYHLRTLLIVLALGPPAAGVYWASRDHSVSHRLPELAVGLGALSVFVFTLHPLTLAASWTVDTTAALLDRCYKRR
jgi:hypothetical protein